MSTRPAMSVVVPAHDEARVVGRCLRALAPLVASGEAEVVVVANGCTDDTAAVARRTEGVRVLELERPSKPAALNAGEAAVTAFPRVYLDADVEVDAAVLRALVAALPDDDVPRVASTAVRFATEGRPWSVRAFYRVYCALPYVQEGLVGLGLYAVNRSGRGRFGAIPPVVADDAYVQRQFAPAERVVLRDHAFTVQTPWSLTSLLQVRARSVRGARELVGRSDAANMSSSAESARALVRLVSGRPALLPPAVIYVVVTLMARIRAGLQGTNAGWARDDTTR